MSGIENKKPITYGKQKPKGLQKNVAYGQTVGKLKGKKAIQYGNVSVDATDDLNAGFEAEYN